MDPLKYFNFFRYVPTVEEYFRFSAEKQLPKTTEIVSGRVVSDSNRSFLKGTLRREKISRRKIAKRRIILQALGRLSGVKYLGLSGSVSMLNASDKDDLDIFVITSANRLWTTRLLLILFTSLLGVRRGPKDRLYRDKLCLNLFFSENNLSIPTAKRNIYVAHEILQLKTIINKSEIYEQLLWANRWVKNFFPQLAIPIQKKSLTLRKARPLPERLARWLQLKLINRHRTTEIITDTQLWFFPDDFEKKLKL